MSRTRAMLMAVLAVLFSAGAAHADPMGTVYDVFLDMFFAPEMPEDPLIIEGHDGTVFFDGAPDLITGGVFFDPGGVLDPMVNDIWVEETVTPAGPGMEIVEIWLFGADGVDSVAPPPVGDFGPLFINPLVMAEAVFFDVTGLNWGTTTDPAIAISEVELVATFAGGTMAEPLIDGLEFFFFTDGEGTIDDPLSIFIDIDPIALLDPGTLTESATDLHLSFKVTHVPEPATAMLLTTLAGGLALRRRRR